MNRRMVKLILIGLLGFSIPFALIIFGVLGTGVTQARASSPTQRVSIGIPWERIGSGMPQQQGTVKRKALVETATGKVKNVIVIADGASYNPPSGQSLVDAGNASPGDTWNGLAFVSPTPTPASTINAVAQLADLKVQKDGTIQFTYNVSVLSPITNLQVTVSILPSDSTSTIYKKVEDAIISATGVQGITLQSESIMMTAWR